MAEVMNYTNPLGGDEVVEDILGQIRKRLATDCNLRKTDGYSGGYSGKVIVSLKLHAVRISEVEMEIAVAQSPSLAAPSVDSFPPEDVEPVEIDEEIRIPLEPNLKEVRERIEENKQEPIIEPAGTEQPETEARTKRKYTRRGALVSAVTE